MWRQLYLWFALAIVVSACVGQPNVPPSDKTEAYLSIGQTLLATFESYSYRITFLAADENGCHVKFGETQMPPFHGRVSLPNVETETKLIEVQCEVSPGSKVVTVIVPENWTISFE